MFRAAAAASAVAFSLLVPLLLLSQAPLGCRGAGGDAISSAALQLPLGKTAPALALMHDGRTLRKPPFASGNAKRERYFRFRRERLLGRQSGHNEIDFHGADDRQQHLFPLGGGLAITEYTLALNFLASSAAGNDYFSRGSCHFQTTSFTLQIDTGSADLALVSTRCGESCGKHAERAWDPFDHCGSSTVAVPCGSPDVECSRACHSDQHQQQQCRYKKTYEDGTGFSAAVFNQTMFLHGLPALRGVAGAVTAVRAPAGQRFEPFSVEGIIGFAQRAASAIKAPTLFENMLGAGTIKEPVFSMCGRRSGGLLTLGGIGKHYTGVVRYTPLVNATSGFYNVDGRDLLVNGRSVGVAPSRYTESGCSVDSGTSTFSVPTPAFWSFYELLRVNCSANSLVGVCNVSRAESLFSGRCLPLTSRELAAWPTLTFAVGRGADEVRLELLPHQYLLPGCGKHGHVSLWVDAMGPGGGALMGDPFMLAYEVVYDIGRSRVGFAPLRACG